MRKTLATVLSSFCVVSGLPRLYRLLVIGALLCATAAWGTETDFFFVAPGRAKAALQVLLGASNANQTVVPLVRPNGSNLSIARNSAQAYTDDAGVLQSAKANSLGCNSSGCFIYQSYTETLLQTATILTEAGSPDSVTAPWGIGNAVVGNPVANIVSTTLPDGTTGNAFQFDFPAISGATNYSVVYQAFTATAAAWVGSEYVKASGAACTTYHCLTDFGSGTTCSAINATSSWQRPNVSRTLDAASRYISIGPDGRAFTGQPTTQAACSVILWQANATASAVALPPVTAVAGTVVVPANAVGAAAFSALNAFTVRMTMKAAAWNTSASAWLFASPFGSGYGGANSISAYEYNGSVSVDVYDAASALRRFSFSVPGADWSEKQLSFCYYPGSVRAFVSGVEQSVSVAGAGTGVMSSAVSSLAIANSGAGGSPINSAISSVSVIPGCRP